MRLTALFTAVLLPFTSLSSQVPLVTEDKLSKVISDSLFLSLHRSICEIDSITNKENRVGIWLKKFLEKHHFKVTLQPIPQRKGKPTFGAARYNVYAYPDPSHYKTVGSEDDETIEALHQPKVLLTSHIDTVPPFIPYSLSYKSRSGGFNRSNVLIQGRGTVDAKACVASQITVVMELLESKAEGFSPKDIALLFVVDEESGGVGMTKFSESSLYKSTNKNYKAVIFGEPTERKLVAGHKGILLLKIDATGRAAHSGYPWLGRSANSMILPALYKLDQLSDVSEDEGGLPSSEKFGNTTINVGLMQGGVASNVVPEHAYAEIAFRLAGGTVEQNEDIITKVVQSVDPKGLLEYEFGSAYAPVNLDVDVEGFESITVNYGTDVPNLKVADGVKRYLYGPGTIFVAHGPDEALTVGELEAGLEGYMRLVKHALAL